MRATRSGIVIGLVLALLVPGSVVGQEAPGEEVEAISGADDCLTWTKYGSEWLGSKDAYMTAVAPLPDGGAIIVGRNKLQPRGTQPRAMAWVTDDGLNWEAIRLPGKAPAEATGVAVVGDEVIAVGWTSGIWRSPDARTWSKPDSGPKGLVRGVVATPDGPALYGESDLNKQNRGKPTVWTEQDGKWKSTTFGKRNWHLGRLVVSPEGIWLMTAIDDDFAARMWRSEDGVTWNEVPVPDGMRDALFLWTEVRVTHGPTGFLVGDGDAVWLSPDGMEWRQVAGLELSVAAVGQGPCGWLAFTRPPYGKKGGYKQADALIHISEDGESWNSVIEDAFAKSTVWGAAMTENGQVIALGGNPSKSTMVWVGKSDGTAEGLPTTESSVEPPTE